MLKVKINLVAAVQQTVDKGIASLLFFFTPLAGIVTLQEGETNRNSL